VEDAIIIVTNLPEHSPDRLRRTGHKLRGTSGSMHMWVHPTGKEVWILPSPNPAAKTSPTVDPLVDQATIYVGESTSARDRITALGESLRRSVGRPEYGASYAKFFSE
jgi:hypothetical protein